MQEEIKCVLFVPLQCPLVLKYLFRLMLAQEPLPSSGRGKIPGSRGSIVNWCSWVSFHSSKTNYAYAASKYGVRISFCSRLSRTSAHHVIITDVFLVSISWLL